MYCLLEITIYRKWVDFVSKPLRVMCYLKKYYSLDFIRCTGNYALFTWNKIYRKWVDFLSKWLRVMCYLKNVLFTANILSWLKIMYGLLEIDKWVDFSCNSKFQVYLILFWLINSIFFWWGRDPPMSPTPSPSLNPKKTLTEFNVIWRDTDGIPWCIFVFLVQTCAT